MRILCLDVGSKRIGMAVTDPLGWTAQGLGVIERASGKRSFEEIARWCRELGVTTLLIGLPLDEEGEEGPQAQKVQAFAKRLESFLQEAGIAITIEMWDERYSTAKAEERLIDADVSRAKRRRVLDKMAAVVILEDYLQAHELEDADAKEDS